MITPNPRAASDDRLEQEITPQAQELGDDGFDQYRWAESRAEGDLQSAGGRAVLGWALAVLAALWIGFTAWSAGRAPLSPSSVYACAAVLAGAAYVAFTPSPGIDVPALVELAADRGLPYAGSDGKTADR